MARTETAARETLFNQTLSARNSLLRALNESPDTYTEPTTNALLGHCPRNAIVLLNTLTNEWTHGDVVLRVGALDTGAAPISPDTFEPYSDYWTYLKANGMIHYWVEATDDTLNTTFECEIAADRQFASPSERDLNGYPRVSPSTPSEYTPMQGTYTLSDISNGDTPHTLLVLWNAVWQARQRLLSHTNDSEQTAHVLDGRCHETSEALLETLAQAWNTSTDSLHNGPYAHRADCYIQFGGITNTDTPNTYQHRLDVERDGTDHFWVEAIDSKTNTYYIIDCFSNDPSTYGEPIVQTTYPDSYAPVTDGRFPTEAVFNSPTWWRAIT